MIESTQIVIQELVLPYMQSTKVQIQPLEERYKYQVIELITRRFISKEPIFVTINYSFSEAYKIIKQLTDKCIKYGHGCVCIDKEKDLVVCALLCEDEFTGLSEPWIFEKDFIECQKHRRLSEFFTSLQKNYPEIYACKNQGEKMHVVLVATHEYYGQQGILRNALQYCMQHHPQMKSYKHFIAECTNIYSLKSFQKAGYQAKVYKKLEDIQNDKGELIVLPQFKELLKEKQVPLEVGGETILVEIQNQFCKQ